MIRGWLMTLPTIALVLSIPTPARPAPAPKPADKPEPPPNAAQYEQSQEKLKQIGLAIHNYHDQHNSLPANLTTKDGKPGLSWRVQLLPYLEAEELFKEFRLDEPWDSKHNVKLVERIPNVFAPVRGKAEKGQSFYQMFAGKDTLLGPDGKGVNFAQVTDGLSNTVMVAEGARAVTWTKPDDIPFDGKTVPKLGGMFNGEFHALFCDGAVRRIPRGLREKALLLLIRRSDGEAFDTDAEIEQARGKE